MEGEVAGSKSMCLMVQDGVTASNNTLDPAFRLMLFYFRPARSRELSAWTPMCHKCLNDGKEFMACMFMPLHVISTRS